jgi:hypothetical protein
MVVLHVVKPPLPSQFDATALSDPYLPVANVRIWTPPHLLALRFLATRYDCSRISGLSKTSVTEVGPRWAFARRLLIGFPGFAPVDIPRLFRRRFDLFAIARDARNRDR